MQNKLINNTDLDNVWIEVKTFEDIINDSSYQGIIWCIIVPLLVVSNIKECYGYSITSRVVMTMLVSAFMKDLSRVKPHLCS